MNHCLNRNLSQNKYDLSAFRTPCHSTAVYQPLTQPQVQIQTRPYGISSRQSGNVTWFSRSTSIFPSTIPLMLHTHISIIYHQRYIILATNSIIKYISHHLPSTLSLICISEITDNLQNVVILKCRT